MGLPFPRLTKLEVGETVVFSWIVYKSRSHRDRGNAKVMKDPRIKGLCEKKSMPFDMKRLAYGGFKVVVDASVLGTRGARRYAKRDELELASILWRCNMTDIIHRVGIKAGPDNVFWALTTIEGLAAWWTENTTGVSDVGNTVVFQFRDPNGEIKGGFEMDVLKQEPFKRVQWTCTKGPEEWVGTDITFDLKQEDDFTIVLFAHRNWQESSEFTAHCSTKWAVFLMSLKQLIETGSGKPAPRDIKIDNWN